MRRDRVATRQSTRIVALAVALAVILAAPLGPRAVAAGSPPITIPPAQVLPPLPPPPPPPQDLGALLPTHVQILRDSQGSGIAMYGALTGKVASATGVTLAIFTNSGAFDPTPAPQLVLADQDDRRAQALFTATVQGVPVIGITAVALSDTSGDVTVFYDAANAFAKSFLRMQQTLKDDWGLQTVMLSPLHLDDGSEIGLPPGWRVTAQGANSVDLQGPQGEFIALGATMLVHAGDTGTGGLLPETPCCDPRNAFETLFPKIAAAAQRRGFPAQELTGIVEVKLEQARSSGQGALILSNLRVGGEDYTYFAAADAVASFADPWTFTLSGVMAPQAIFATEFPTLMQIWNSYRAVHPGFGLNLWLPDAVLGMGATQAMLNAAITRRATADYNANAAWDQIIVAITKAEPAQIDNSLAQPLADKLSSSTGRPWQILPATELR